MQYIRLLTACAAVTLVACGARDQSGDPAAAGEAVATVNGEPISRNLYEYYARGSSGKAASELTAEQREQVLDALVRAKVVAQEAQKSLAKDADTSAMLELARINVLQQAASEQYLKDKPASEKELRAEYETQIAQLPKLEYRARHILVATEPFAQKLIAQLDKGANFAEIAQRESMDGSKQNGGDLGWFTTGSMVKPFSDAVVALKPGQYTRTPVQTQFGWHIIRLDETRELQPPPYDQVRQRLEQAVQSRKLRQYSDGLIKTAKVDKTLPKEAAPAAAAAEPAQPAASEPANAAANAAPAAPAAATGTQ
jgi:peptidyl-prolyl cis-trans isomerase C